MSNYRTHQIRPIMDVSGQKPLLVMPSVQSPTASTRILVARKTKCINNSSAEQNAAGSYLLCEKILGDVAVATGVTFFVTPFLTVVDKAIVQSAAGSHTLLQSGLESVNGILRNPVAYVRSPTFLLMWGVYAATYSTANTMKTFAEHKDYSEARQKSLNSNPGGGKMGIFLGTTFVNTSASLMKDRAYARMFGSCSVTTVVPRMSYGLWIARDFSVIGSSFILPDLVSGHIVEKYEIDPKIAQSSSQLALPVVMQFIAGPLHYLGLDLYNRNLSTKGWTEAIVDRSKSLCRGFVPVVVARIARIAPGYSVGGVFNTRFREAYRDHLINRKVKAMMLNPNELSASRIVELIYGKSKITKP